MAAAPYPAYKNEPTAKPMRFYICNMTATVLTPAEIGEPERE